MNTIVGWSSTSQSSSSADKVSRGWIREEVEGKRKKKSKNKRGKRREDFKEKLLTCFLPYPYNWRRL